MQEIFDWRSIGRNPVSLEVKEELHKALLKRRAGRVFDFDKFLRDFVCGRSVLDIGMVEHEITHVESDMWLHRKICEWGSHVLGIDVQEPELEILRQRGFNVICADATSDVDLGERFDRVFMGEIIEHVDQPVELLRFAARHLTQSGRILVTTPNPWYFREILSTYKNGINISNAEHVTWIAPAQALELGWRAGLTLEQYWLAQGRSRSPMKILAHKVRDVIAGEDSEFFSSKYLYIWTKPEGKNV